MRKAKIYFREIFAGYLEEVDMGYRFTYDKQYLDSRHLPNSKPIFNTWSSNSG